VLWSIGRTIEATGAHAPQAWRRHLAFMLDGFRAGAATPLPATAESGRTGPGHAHTRRLTGRLDT
jgi:hypothetical protein